MSAMGQPVLVKLVSSMECLVSQLCHTGLEFLKYFAYELINLPNDFILTNSVVVK